MALVETTFSNNEAGIAGGAVFTGYLEAIRFRCTDASSDAGLDFYTEQEWKDLRHVESDKDICSSWKGNRAEAYGQDIGTHASAAQMTLDDTNKTVCVSGGENCMVDGYQVGTDLPAATVKLLDGLGQITAKLFRRVNANMSSLSSDFLFWPILLPMENDPALFDPSKPSYLQESTI